jgi:hypothetical protein
MAKGSILNLRCWQIFASKQWRKCGLGEGVSEMKKGRDCERKERRYIMYVGIVKEFQLILESEFINP